MSAGHMPANHLLISQVFYEDDDSIVIKILKDQAGSKYDIQDGDAFYSMAFFKSNDDGSVSSWIPWEET